MWKYGPATNFHGGPGEEHYRDNVKKSGATHKNVLFHTHAKFLREVESRTSYLMFIDLWKISAFHHGKNDGMAITVTAVAQEL